MDEKLVKSRVYSFFISLCTKENLAGKSYASRTRINQISVFMKLKCLVSLPLKPYPENLFPFPFQHYALETFRNLHQQ